MLALFDSIFKRHHAVQRYPEALVKRAIERAIDSTDCRMRILPGYAKQLRPAVLHAMDHVVQLVDSLAVPVPMTADTWNQEITLHAMFSSGERLQEILSRDPAYRDFIAASAESSNKPLTALLLANYSEKHTFGVDLINDNLISDVPLTVVSFDEHRLLGLAASETETRRILKTRAYDYLLTLVLEKITAVREKREDLAVRKKLLCAKLDVLARGSGNFSVETCGADRAQLQQKLEQIEIQLAEMGADDTVLQHHLDIVTETLLQAGQQLWLECSVLYMDPSHIMRTSGHPKADAVPLQMLRDVNGKQLAVLLITLA
jgi:hypothetical protein